MVSRMVPAQVPGNVLNSVIKSYTYQLASSFGDASQLFVRHIPAVCTAHLLVL